VGSCFAAPKHDGRNRVIKHIMGHDIVADTLGGVFDWAVGDHPDTVFARFDEDDFTLAELDDMARRVGAALASSGVGAGDRVSALMYPSPWHLALLLACARHGVVWCPLNVALGSDDLAYALEDLEPRLVLVDSDLRETLDSVRDADDALAALPVVECAVYDHKGGPAFLDGWLTQARASGRCEAAASDTFAIVYSGGTTGRPKGLEISQFYVVGAALRLEEIADYDERETFFTTLQFSHAWTPITVLPWCLMFDHVFAFWRWWSATRFIDMARHYEATITDVYVGMAATLFHGEVASDTRDIPATRSIAGWGGAEETSVRIRRRFEERFGVTTLQMYALTEVGPLACIEWEGEEQRYGSSGKPRGWYDVVVVDDDGMPLPPGDVGEILVRPNYPNIIVKGYLNREAHTLDSWRDLWIHTGDLGRFDEDGYLWFVGRQGHFVKRRGELVSIGEVEATIESVDGVDEVAVFGVPSEMGEEDLKAVVTLRPDATTTTQDIVDQCAARLATFKVPRYVEIIDEMPRSATKQELERFRLKDLPLGEPLQPTERRSLGYTT
jgi:crotonobetaine/carnitine-CoA ligase